MKRSAADLDPAWCAQIEAIVGMLCELVMDLSNNKKSKLTFILFMASYFNNVVQLVLLVLV